MNKNMGKQNRNREGADTQAYLLKLLRAITDSKKEPENEEESTSEESLVEEATLSNEITPVDYLNPLTLQAHIFLEALKTAKVNCKKMDEVLCQTLIEIIKEIDSFTDKSFEHISTNEKITVMTPEKLNCIKCVYQCNSCQMHFGKLRKVCKHLRHGHAEVKPATEQPITAKPNDAKRNSLDSKIVGKKIKKAHLPQKTISLINSNLHLFLNDGFVCAKKLKSAPEHILIANDLTKILKDIYPNTSVEVFTFGSRIIGTANYTSDLDIFANIGDVFHIFERSGSNVTLEKLRKVRIALKNSKHIFKTFQAIEKARVPIIKVIHMPTGIHCDIGFSNALGFCNSTLMEYLFRLQPMACKICIFMKRWMQRSKMSQISSYTVTLLTVFFLQIRKQLPPIADLIDHDSKVGPWSSAFHAKSLADFNMTEQRSDTSNWLNMQIEFFEFFANFEFNKFIVSTYLGCPVAKSDLKKKMPQCYNEWVRNNEGLHMTTVIVQDPLELTHNVAKNIGERKFSTLVSYFDISAKLLAKHKNSY